MKLDLGCGLRKQPGFVGVDLSPDCGADVIHDLRTAPWPFDDESIDEAYCAHFLEHLDGAQRIVFMQELHRVLKPGAMARVITPYWTSVGAIQDPTHQWPPIAEQSYLYFNAKARRDMGMGHYAIRTNFDLAFGLVMDPKFQGKPEGEQAFAARHFFNVVHELHATLTKLPL
jgi:hypothetical protein